MCRDREENKFKVTNILAVVPLTKRKKMCSSFLLDHLVSSLKTHKYTHTINETRVCDRLLKSFYPLLPYVKRERERGGANFGIH